MALRFEIMESVYRRGMWNIREGDIEGSTECINMSMEEVLDFIKERMEIERRNQIL